MVSTCIHTPWGARMLEQAAQQVTNLNTSLSIQDTFTGCVEAGIQTFLVTDDQDRASWLDLASATIYYNSGAGKSIYDQHTSELSSTEIGEFVRVNSGEEFQLLEDRCDPVYLAC